MSKPARDTKAKLLDRLKELSNESRVRGADHEHIHMDADTALLRFIGDVEVEEVFDDIRKWYA